MRRGQLGNSLDCLATVATNSPRVPENLGPVLLPREIEDLHRGLREGSTTPGPGLLQRTVSRGKRSSGNQSSVLSTREGNSVDHQLQEEGCDFTPPGSPVSRLVDTGSDRDSSTSSYDWESTVFETRTKEGLISVHCSSCGALLEICEDEETS